MGNGGSSGGGGGSGGTGGGGGGGTGGGGGGGGSGGSGGSGGAGGIIIGRSFVAVKSNDNYKHLHYVEDGESDGLVQFSGDDHSKPHAKFEVEPAKSGNGLVHVKCCYNNKYLQKAENGSLIAALADAPVEDKNNPSCTLFEPRIDPVTNTTQIRHVQQEKFLTSSTNTDHSVHVGTNNHQSDAYTIMKLDN